MGMTRLWLAASLIALTSQGAVLAQGDQESARSGDSFPDYFYIPGQTSYGGIEFSGVTHDASKERGIQSGYGLGIAYLSDIDVFRIIRAAQGGEGGIDPTLGGTASARPFIGAEFFKYDTDTTINFNQPGGLDQILENAYSAMLRAGLDGEVLVVDGISAFGSIAGGVDLRWGNLVPNPQGFNPAQTQRNTPDPTEFYTGGLFRAGGGIRFHGRAGTVGVGVFG